MILASLARYYRRLATQNDDFGNPKVPPYGFIHGFWRLSFAAIDKYGCPMV